MIGRNFYEVQHSSLDKLYKIREEIDKEYENEKADKDKINKLMYQQLMVSLPLTVQNRFSVPY